MGLAYAVPTQQITTQVKPAITGEGVTGLALSKRLPARGLQAVLITRIYERFPPLSHDWSGAQMGADVEVEPDWNLAAQPAFACDIARQVN